MSSTGVFQRFLFFLILSRLLTVPNRSFDNTEVDVPRPGISKSAPLLEITFSKHLSRCEILISEAGSRLRMTARSHTFKRAYSRLLDSIRKTAGSKNAGGGSAARAPPHLCASGMLPFKEGEFRSARAGFFFKKK